MAISIYQNNWAKLKKESGKRSKKVFFRSLLINSPWENVKSTVLSSRSHPSFDKISLKSSLGMLFPAIFGLSSIPLCFITRGLQALEGPTGCVGIVNWNIVNQIANTVTILNLIP